jgi:uncharacterized protein YecT (DUF1311 family)
MHMRLTPATGFVFTLALMSVASSAFAASFDCSKARSDVEKVICKDADISSLDDKLQHSYETALGSVRASFKPELTKEQRDWVIYIRNICQDAACLNKAYASRIAVLARKEESIVDETSCQVPSGGGQCINVVTYRDPSIRIRSFNESLAEQKQSGKIIGCSRLINLPVGTADGNNSFGGICISQNGKQREDVEICNDDMIGRFQTQKIDPKNVSDNDLIDFVLNCPGG